MGCRHAIPQKTVPMAVGGMGMISTANYVARKYGVRSAMPGFIGRKLCPKVRGLSVKRQNGKRKQWGPGGCRTTTSRTAPSSLLAAARYSTRHASPPPPFGWTTHTTAVHHVLVHPGPERKHSFRFLSRKLPSCVSLACCCVLQLVFVPPDFNKYTAVAQRVRAVFRQLDPDFESGGLDEAHLDVTDYCRSTGRSGEEVSGVGAGARGWGLRHLLLSHIWGPLPARHGPRVGVEGRGWRSSEYCHRPWGRTGV